MNWPPFDGSFRPQGRGHRRPHHRTKKCFVLRMTVFRALVHSGKECGLYLHATLKILIVRAPSLTKHVMCIHMFMFLSVCSFVHSFVHTPDTVIPTLYINTSVYTKVIHVYTYVCTHIHTHTYTYIYTYVYVYIYAHTCTYTYTHRKIELKQEVYAI